MKKGLFYKIFNKGKVYGIKQYEGLIDQENQIAYSKSEGYHCMSENWIATDMFTGYKFAWGSTKTECIESMKQKKDILNKLRTEQTNGACYVDYNGMKKVLSILIKEGKELTESKIKKMLV